MLLVRVNHDGDQLAAIREKTESGQVNYRLNACGTGAAYTNANQLHVHLPRNRRRVSDTPKIVAKDCSAARTHAVPATIAHPTTGRTRNGEGNNIRPLATMRG